MGCDSCYYGRADIEILQLLLKVRFCSVRGIPITLLGVYLMHWMNDILEKRDDRVSRRISDHTICILQ